MCTDYSEALKPWTLLPDMRKINCRLKDEEPEQKQLVLLGREKDELDYPASLMRSTSRRI